MPDNRLHTEIHGSGSRLVLLHGFTQNSACWDGIADDLARDHEVVLVDVPGHGRSPAATADLWTTAELVAAAGGRACHIGYSMGGRILLHLALQSPQLVERLVLISTTAGIDNDAERRERIRHDEELADRLERIGVEAFVDEWMSQAMFARLEASRAGRQARLTNTASGLASSLRSVGTGTQEPLWDRLSSLSMPVFVVAGADDTKFTQLARRLATEIGPNAESSVIPRAGHAAHLEQPDEFCGRLRDWMDRTG